MSEKIINELIEAGLREDLGEYGDITSNLTIPENKIINFSISNREEIILCGVDIALKIFAKTSGNKNLEIKKHFHDGEFLPKNTIIISGKGNARAIFAAERLALNLLQHLSGISTNTHKFVQELEGKTQILDTRKTIPSLRYLQKYAVKIGGGKNHRMALYDGILIKDNHIAAAGSIAQAVQIVKDHLKDQKNKSQIYHNLIEVECDNLTQVQEAVDANADIIMLDNMNLETIKKAVKLIDNKAKIEVSGGITLERIKDISKTGVDFISVGALTHSVKAVDIGLDL